MASKGNDRHMKRLAAPTYSKIDRKKTTYVTKPNAGRFTGDTSVALITVIKEKLRLADTSREARTIIKKGEVEVNGRIVRDDHYPIGFSDMIHFKSANQSFAVGVGRYGVITITPLKGNEPWIGKMPAKVIGKYTAKGNKPMLRLFDGRNVPAHKDANVNDSVGIKDGKVESVLKAKEGAKCLVITGNHATKTGVIVAVKKGTALRNATVEIDSPSGKFETLMDNVMVIGA